MGIIREGRDGIQTNRVQNNREMELERGSNGGDRDGRGNRTEELDQTSIEQANEVNGNGEIQNIQQESIVTGLSNRNRGIQNRQQEVIGTGVGNEVKLCNCRKKCDCPLGNRCLSKNIIYSANIRS